MDLYSYLKAVHSADGPDDPRVREVLTLLGLHRNRDTGLCNPGTRRLADESTMVRNTIKAKLDRAEELGWIRRTLHDRGGETGAQTRYELTIPERPEGVSQGDPLPTNESGSGSVTRSGESKRVNFDTQAGQNDGSSGSISAPKRVNPGWPVTEEQEEQKEQKRLSRASAREAGRSTGERQRPPSRSAEFGADRIARAAKAVSKRGRAAAIGAWIEADPDSRVPIAEGLQHLVATGEEFTRGELFYSLEKLFEAQPELAARCESAWLKLEAKGNGRRGSGELEHVAMDPLLTLPSGGPGFPRQGRDG